MKKLSSLTLLFGLLSITANASGTGLFDGIGTLQGKSVYKLSFDEANKDPKVTLEDVKAACEQKMAHAIDKIKGIQGIVVNTSECFAAYDKDTHLLKDIKFVWGSVSFIR